MYDLLNNLRQKPQAPSPQCFRIAILLCCLLLGDIVSTRTASAQFREERIPQSQPGALQRALDATVRIQTYDFERNETIGVGSGTIIHKDGYVLTNYHVIEESQIFDGKVLVLIPIPNRNDEFDIMLGEVIATDPQEDLALVQITEDADGGSVEATEFPTISIGDSSAVQLGDNVYAVGYPNYNGYQQTLTSGIVSGRVTHEERLYLSTDVDLSNGNSGGALIDKNSGELIGIPTFIGSPTPGVAHGFTRPINVSRRIFTIDPDSGELKINSTPGQSSGGIRTVCADDFSTNINGWDIGYFDSDNVENESILSGGQLTFLTAFKKDAYTWLKAPECDARNAIMIVDAQFIEVSDADVGIMFLLRYRDRTNPKGRDHLRVSFYADNSYEIDVRFKDEWTTLQERTAHSALRLRQGEVNRIAIGMDGEHYRLYANEVELTTVTHNEPNSGKFALGIIGDAGTQAHVRFDNFAVVIPGSTSATFYDDFSDNHNNWLLGEISTADGDIANDWIRNGYLEQKISVQSDSWQMFSGTFDFTATDFYLQTKVAIVDTNNDDSWISILLRYNRETGDFYRVRLSPDGYYRIDMQKDGDLYILQQWTRSSTNQLKSGKMHDITVWLRGQHLTLGINGIELTTVQDNRVQGPGIFAFELGGPQGTQSTVVYDEVSITEQPD